MRRPIPKPRTWLVQCCSPIHIHACLTPLQPVPRGRPLKKSSSPSEQEPPRNVLTGRPTSPGRPGSPDSPGSPCRGEKRVITLLFLQGGEFSADVAKPLRERRSKLLRASVTFVWMLYLLSYCTRISYSPGRTLWTICSWWSRWTSGSRWAWRALKERRDKFKTCFLEQRLSVMKKEV